MLRGGDETRTMYVVMFTTNITNDTTTTTTNTAAATITTNTREEHPIRVQIGSPDRQSRSDRLRRKVPTAGESRFQIAAGPMSTGIG